MTIRQLRPLRRRSAAAVVLALALAGCGGGPGSDRADTLTPQAALAAAVTQTQEVSSYRFAMTSTTTGAGTTIEMTMEGAARTDASAGEITTSMTLPGNEIEIRQLLVDGVMYMEMPQEPGVFYSLRLDDVVDTSLGSSADPTQGLEVLRAASDDITEVGSEDVRGDETTHYRGTIDISRALEVIKGPMRDQLQQVLSSGSEDGMPFDAWIDDEGRLRRLDQTITVSPSQLAGQSLEVTSRMEMYDFGVEVAVEAPPADAVRDGKHLLDALGGAAVQPS